MKQKLTDELRDIFIEGRQWLRYEIDYAKLTMAEKATILASAVALGAVCLLLGIVVLIMLALSLKCLFELFMAPALAYLCSAGCIAVILVVVMLLRKPLILDPIARFLTKLFIQKD